MLEQGHDRITLSFSTIEMPNSNEEMGSAYKLLTLTHRLPIMYGILSVITKLDASTIVPSLNKMPNFMVSFALFC